MKLLIFTLIITGCTTFFHKSQKKYLPDYVISSPEVKKAYLIAIEIKEKLNEYPCYCECMEYEGHRGLYDCFFTRNGNFNLHGAECDICIEETIEVDKNIKQGKTPYEIKEMLEIKYGN